MYPHPTSIAHAPFGAEQRRLNGSVNKQDGLGWLVVGDSPSKDKVTCYATVDSQYAIGSLVARSQQCVNLSGMMPAFQMGSKSSEKSSICLRSHRQVVLPESQPGLPGSCSSVSSTSRSFPHPRCRGLPRTTQIRAHSISRRFACAWALDMWPGGLEV